MKFISTLLIKHEDEDAAVHQISVGGRSILAHWYFHGIYETYHTLVLHAIYFLQLRQLKLLVYFFLSVASLVCWFGFFGKKFYNPD